MPNPPITIGELSNVPAPLSPVNSDWAQDVTRRVVMMFVDDDDRAARYPDPIVGALSRVQSRQTLDQWSGIAWIPVGSGTRIDPVYSAPAGGGTGGAILPGGSGRVARFTMPRDGSARFDYSVLLAAAGGGWTGRLILQDATGGGATLWSTFIDSVGGNSITAFISSITVSGLGDGQLIDVVLINNPTSTGQVSWFTDITNNRGVAYVDAP